MARIQVFQGGNVQLQGVTDARARTVDFGPSPLAAGLSGLGEMGTKVVEKLDEMEDVKSKIEANRSAIQLDEASRTIGRRVKQARGEDAEGAAATGVAELQQAAQDIMGRAGPRARVLLESVVAKNVGVASDSWLEHGDREKVTAFDDSSKARISRILDTASDEDDEGRAVAILGQVKQVNDDRAEFLGKGEDWLIDEERGQYSQFYKSRAIRLATGPMGSSSAVIAYATKNRQFLTDTDYNALISSYNDSAMDEVALVESYGGVAPGTAVIPAAPAETAPTYSSLPRPTTPYAQLTKEDTTSLRATYDKATPEAAPAFYESGQKIPFDDWIGKPKAEAPAASTQTSDGGPPRRLDPQAFWRGHIMPWEGGSKTLVDSNGHLVQYGINKQHNPDMPVGKLTEAMAYDRYYKNYYLKSGADKLSPALAAVHLDTFYLNEREAMRMLRDSGNSVDKYVELRNSFLNGLTVKNPGKYAKYKRGWQNRTNAVAGYGDRLGGDGTHTAAPVTPTTNLDDRARTTMARTDIGLNMKRRIIAQDSIMRGNQRQEIAVQEDTADRQLLAAAQSLGEGFTDVTQLPPDEWSRAPATVKDRYLAMAATNKRAAENKPLSAEVEARIGFLQTDPETLKSPAVQHELVRLGVPAARRAELARQGGIAYGERMSGTPQPVDRGILQTEIREAFQAHGVRLWSTEAKSGSVAARVEIGQDAQRSAQALAFIQDEAQTWAFDNPGKKAPLSERRRWYATALIPTARGPLGGLTDAQVVQGIPQGRKEALAIALKKDGKPFTVANIAQLYRHYLVINGFKAR